MTEPEPPGSELPGLKYPRGLVITTTTTRLPVQIPQGLPHLLEVLARETLREQPKNIEEYIYNLVTQLLTKRDAAAADVDVESEGQKSENTEPEQVPDVQIQSRSQDIEVLKANDEQLVQKSQSQQEKKKIESDNNGNSEAVIAATKIQAGFRGYKTRKNLKLAAEAEEEKRTDEEIAAELKSPLQTIKEESFELLNSSAIKIQACFRGYLVRRDGRYMHLHVHDKKSDVDTKSAEADEKADADAEEQAKSLEDLETERELQEMDEIMNQIKTKMQVTTEKSEYQDDFEEDVEQNQGESQESVAKSIEIETLQSEPEKSEEEISEIQKSIEIETDNQEIEAERQESTEIKEILEKSRNVEEIDVEEVKKSLEIDQIEPEIVEKQSEEIPAAETNTINKNLLTDLQLADLEGQIIAADATNKAAFRNLLTEPDPDLEIQNKELEIEPGQSKSASASEDKPEPEPSEVKPETPSSLSEDLTEASEITSDSTSRSTELTEKLIEIPAQVETDKGTMTLEIPTSEAGTGPETGNVTERVEAENPPMLAFSSPPNIIQESLAAVEISESLADSIIQEVENFMNKEDSVEVEPTVPEDVPAPVEEPVVMRRKSKRDSALDKKTRSQYRSGVVALDEQIIHTQLEQLPSVDEVEALVEQEMLENAATKIQAGFRGYKARKSINKASSAASKIQAGFRGFKTRKMIANEKKAVIKIQATVRGFLARRRLAKAKMNRQRRRSSTSSLLNKRRKSSNTLNAAAVRIQAAYRGYRVRRTSPLPQEEPDRDIEINIGEN